ncbi:MAG TPA: carboxypeptidase regulatory-like domain-containing protein [Anditalea sp.]|nr:carboxypeptidase regulatory-like domain-containing protein [Anditalea sp.]
MNTIQYIKAFLAVFFLVLTFSCSEEPEVEVYTTGKLSGHVVSLEGKAIENATVALHSSSFSRTVVTNDFGRYIIEDIPRGNYEIKVSKASFIDAAEMITVQPGIVSEKNFGMKIGEAILEVSDTLIMASTIKSEFELSINSNTSWTAKSSEPWVKLNAEEGIGEKTIKVVWDNNPGDNSREAVIHISAGGIIKEVRVLQTVPLKIISMQGRAGELVSQNKSTIELLFNGHVTIKRITQIFSGCQGELSAPVYNGSKDGLTFTYSCGRMGGKYPFLIEYEDQFGNFYTENIEVDFYDKILEIRGMVVGRFNIPNEDTQWVLTRSPARVYKLDLKSLSIIKEFNIEERFSRGPYITLNPYNNLLYISNGVSIDIINPNTGSLLSTIALPPVPFREYENYFVHEMGFNDKGMGLLKVYETNSSGNTWFVIDTANGNKIFTSEQYGWNDNQFHNISSIRASHDQKTLFMYGDGSGNRGVVQTNQSLNNFDMKYEFNANSFPRIDYSKNDDRKVLVGHDVRVFDENQAYVFDYLGFSVFASDFCYSCGQNSYLYLAATENYKFLIMDYKTKVKLKEFNVGTGWVQITSTFEGNHLVVESNNYGYNHDAETFSTKFYHISTEGFH